MGTALLKPESEALQLGQGDSILNLFPANNLNSATNGEFRLNTTRLGFNRNPSQDYDFDRVIRITDATLPSIELRNEDISNLAGGLWRTKIEKSATNLGIYTIEANLVGDDSFSLVIRPLLCDFWGNIGLNCFATVTPDFNGALGIGYLRDRFVLPGGNPSGGLYFYSENGTMKVQKSDGTIQFLGSPFRDVCRIHGTSSAMLELIDESQPHNAGGKWRMYLDYDSVQSKSYVTIQMNKGTDFGNFNSPLMFDDSGNTAFLGWTNDLTLPNMQYMTGGFYLRNTISDPNANPANGIFLWVESGILKGRDPSGTIADIFPVSSAIDVQVNRNTTTTAIGTTNTLLNTLNYTGNGAKKVVITYTLTVDNTSGGARDVTFKLFRGGAEIDTSDQWTEDVKASDEPDTKTYVWDDVPPSGVQTYEIKASANKTGVRRITNSRLVIFG